MMKGLLAEPTGDVEILRLMPRKMPSACQRDDKGRDPYLIDQEAMNKPHQQPEPQGRRDRRAMVVNIAIHHDRRDQNRQLHQRPDGEVNAGGQDNQHLAQGDNPKKRGLAGNIGQIADGQKALGLRGADDDQNNDEAVDGEDRTVTTQK